MDTHFELFSALFVNMRALNNSVGASSCWKWYRASQGGAGSKSSVYNLFAGLIYDFMVISLQTYSDTLLSVGFLGVWHLFDYLSNNTGAYGSATFTNGKP